MILREDSSSQFMGRQKRALIPFFFYNNYLHCNTLYFKIGISLLIITEVALLQSFFFVIYSLFLRETRYHALTFLDQHRGF